MKLSHDGFKSLIVEGNIGAGKSTFLKIMAQYLDINPVFEPHEKWQQIGSAKGENLLDKFYKDTQRWAYTFQTYAFVSRVVEQEANMKKYPNKANVMERSVYSDRYCFAKNCFEMGLITDLEWELYKQWFAWLVENYTVKPNGFIYLQLDPEISYSRLLKRSRKEEVGVSLDYLKKLHQKHEEWLTDKKEIEDYLKDVPVLVLKCNKDFENDVAEQVKHANQIADFFNIKLIFNKNFSSQTCKKITY